MVKIIESGMLKFGALPRMNDITEANKEIYLSGEPDEVEWEKLDLSAVRLNCVGQISLSQDALFPGFALHAMWGHYAERGEGCCIVFDKNKIVEEANRNAFFHGEVIYDNAIENITFPEKISVEEYMSSHHESLFFHKRYEWEHEQEYRIINLNCDHSVFNGINISDAIVAVIFHTNCKHSIFDCTRVQDYLNKIGHIPTFEYLYSSMWGNQQNNMLIDRNRKNWLEENNLMTSYV